MGRVSSAYLARIIRARISPHTPYEDTRAPTRFTAAGSHTKSARGKGGRNLRVSGSLEICARDPWS
jgi:hypothetical protein